MKTKTERIKILRTQQRKIMERSRETRSDTRKRIQKETAKENKRIKLYKSKGSQIKALITGKLRKRKKKGKRR